MITEFFTKVINSIVIQWRFTLSFRKSQIADISTSEINILVSGVKSIPPHGLCLPFLTGFLGTSLHFNTLLNNKAWNKKMNDSGEIRTHDPFGAALETAAINRSATLSAFHVFCYLAIAVRSLLYESERFQRTAKKLIIRMRQSLRQFTVVPLIFYV